MIKRIGICFKNGLYLAADSFVMLYNHPVLLSYYAILLMLYCIIFIVAYNIIGCHTPFLTVSSEFEIPSKNLLTEIIPSTGGLVYIGLLFSIFLNIFLRSYLGVALIKHTYDLLKQNPASVRHSLAYAHQKWAMVAKWALLVTSVTFFAKVISLLPSNAYAVFATVSTLLLLWSMITFFILPIITLQHKSVLQSVKTSAEYMTQTIVKVCGGLLWVGVLLFLAFAILALIPRLLPSGISAWIEYSSVFAINAILSSAILIFKTKLYEFYQDMQHHLSGQSPADYSQF